MTASEVARALEQVKSLMVTSHVYPDGDAVGSMLALGIALKAAGKHVLLCSPHPVPEIYRFLPSWEEISVEEKWEGVQAIVYLDCTHMERTGPVCGPQNEGLVIFNIDHHVSNTGFGHYNLVNPEAAATAELVYRVLREMRLPIDPDVATCLYTAIMTDTGSFKFDNTKKDTLMIASELVELGAEPGRIAREVYDNKPLWAVALLARALAKIRLNERGDLAWTHLDHKDYEATGAREEDTEGIINYVRGIRGVEVGVLFRELPNGTVRVGFRTKQRVNAHELAEVFGGGGHRRASGCTVEGPMDEVVYRVLTVAERFLHG